MVGTTTKLNEKVLSPAPKATATPPIQPTTVKITKINPKRLNSETLKKDSNLSIGCFEVLAFVSIALKFEYIQQRSALLSA